MYMFLTEILLASKFSEVPTIMLLRQTDRQTDRQNGVRMGKTSDSLLTTGEIDFCPSTTEMPE